MGQWMVSGFVELKYKQIEDQKNPGFAAQTFN